MDKKLYQYYISVPSEYRDEIHYAVLAVPGMRIEREEYSDLQKESWVVTVWYDNDCLAEVEEIVKAQIWWLERISVCCYRDDLFWEQ